MRLPNLLKLTGIGIVIVGILLRLRTILHAPG
jgi:hypothetical protein